MKRYLEVFAYFVHNRTMGCLILYSSKMFFHSILKVGPCRRGKDAVSKVSSAPARLETPLPKRSLHALLFLPRLFLGIISHAAPSPHLQAKELEDLAGNSMNIRACAAAWLCLFSTLDLQKWNQAGMTADTTDPLLHDIYWNWLLAKDIGCCLATRNFSVLKIK